MASGDAASATSGAGDAESASTSSRKGWGQLSIQSKLVTMLLATSILTALVVGVVAYYAGSRALERSALDQLTGIRESREREIRSYLELLQEAQIVFSRGRTTIDAVSEFSEAIHELESGTITAAEQEALDSWYDEFWLPDLEANFGFPLDPTTLVQMAPAALYLQANWTAAQRDYDEAISIDDIGDGSVWSDVHARYHDFFRQITEQFSYEDVLLLDTDGDVIYTAYKGFDLGRNVRTGMLANTILARAYEEAIASNSVDYVALTDFERHPPPYGRPQMWTVSPVGENGEIIGALALKIPLEAINDIMTHGEGWAEEGLGDSGETYLVGPGDGDEILMRTTSRFVIEDPDSYAAQVMSAGAPQSVAEHAVRVGGTVMIQQVETFAAREALNGQTNTTTTDDYRGERVLAAYAPLEFDGLQWGIIAQIDEAEAFAPVRDFARNVALSTAGIVLAVVLASMLLARLFSKPIRLLVDGVRKVASGEPDVSVEATSADEFADLADAFNEMNQSLTDKNVEVGEKRDQYTALLDAIMPAPVARRFVAGEETIAEDHMNVTVILAELVGFDEYASDLSSEQAVSALNGLYQTFDESAAQHGVETARADLRGYVATCGLVVPRIDHARRALACAVDMVEAVETFNARRGTALALRAGLDTGSVSSGLLGRSHSYDIWGRSVARATQVARASDEPGIYVTGDVYERVVGVGQEFDEVDRIESDDGSTVVWRAKLSTGQKRDELSAHGVGDG